MGKNHAIPPHGPTSFKARCSAMISKKSTKNINETSFLVHSSWPINRDHHLVKLLGLAFLEDVQTSFVHILAGGRAKSCITCWNYREHLDVPKIGFFPLQFNEFFIIFTIHFGVPLYLETPRFKYRIMSISPSLWEIMFKHVNIILNSSYEMISLYILSIFLVLSFAKQV